MAHVQSGGTYKLINAKGGTVLDLSGGDNRSIIGYGFHGGDNQKWVLEWQGEGYYIRNSGSGLYLTFEGDPRDGCPVIAAGHPTLWDVRPDDEDGSVHRVVLHNTPFNVDLTDFGNPTPGTPIQLWGQWNARNQCWRFEYA